MNFHLKEWVKTVCPVKSCFRSLNPDSCLKKRGGGLYVPYTEEGHGNPFQYSRLDNPMDRGALWAIICRVAKN